MTMFGLFGKLTTHPGQRDTLVGHLLEAAELLRSAEGCYLYVVSSAADDPDAVHVMEVWRSAEDHRASLTLPAVQALISTARPLLAGAPEGVSLITHGGKMDGAV